VKKGVVKLKDIDDDVFKGYMYTSDMTDPDLLIRTGGEMRVSNFLLWEVSYAELWFTSVYWPEFRKKHLEDALGDYAKRERRYGGLIE
jgi:undecaprenyl diphosphate synthase